MVDQELIAETEPKPTVYNQYIREIMISPAAADISSGNLPQQRNAVDYLWPSCRSDDRIPTDENRKKVVSGILYVGHHY